MGGFPFYGYGHHRGSLYMKSTPITLVFFLAAFLLWGGNCRAQTDWEVIDAANSPGARIGQGMTTLPDGRILLFGGEDDAQNIYNDLFAYDSKQWSPITSTNTSPAARRNQVTWYRDGKLYIHGGVAKNHELLDDLWAFDVAKKEWAAVQTTGEKKPLPRYTHAATPLPDGSVILTGGVSDKGFPMREAWKLNIDRTYTLLGYAPVAMANHVAQLVDGVLYLLGAEKVVTFNTQTNEWAGPADGPPITGGATSALGVNGAGQKVIYVMGGVDTNGAESKVVHEYNTTTGALSQRPEQMPFFQKWASSARQNSPSLNGIIFGGVSNGFYTNRTLKFSPGTLSPTVQLTVNKTGNGTVASTPSGIDCGSDCTETYVSGTSATLTGTPADDSRFAGWSGGCSEMPTCSIDMIWDRTVTANFVQRTTPKGDVDANNLINLADAILALQISAGMSPAGKTVTLDADVNNNGRIGLVEVIYILQKTGGTR